MDSYRSALEVAKWLSAKDCLVSVSVSATWWRVCESSELWLVFLEGRLCAPDPGLSPKAFFRCHRNPLPLLTPKHLHLYIPDTRVWQTLPLSISIPTARTSSWVVAPAGYFLVSGGFQGTGYLVNSREVKTTAFQVHQSGLVVPVQSMLYRRMSHGMIVVNNTCYVFGGHNGFDAMTATEKLSLGCLTAKTEWVAMQAMLGPRYCCNPCEYHGAVYLVGGVTFDSELFHPLTETFEAIELNVAMGNSCAVVRQDELVVLLPTEIYRKDREGWRKTQREQQAAYGNLKPVLRDGKCWMLDARQTLVALEINLDTGDIVYSTSPHNSSVIIA